MRSVRMMWAVALICVTCGCKKSPSSEDKATPGKQAVEGSTLAPDGSPPIVRIHWLGKERLSSDTNAAYFMSIWNLPESVKLEGQTLDKLSTAPWRLLGKAPLDHSSALTNPAVAASGLLRPLLDDLVQKESHFELRQETKGTIELALAIRLDDSRADLWRTNLGAVVMALFNLSPTTPTSAGGWAFTLTNLAAGSTNLLRQIAMTRSGQWTFIAAADGPTNRLLAKMMGQVQSKTPPATNYWLQANADLRRASEVMALGWKLPSEWPKIDLKILGDGENVRSWAELAFAESFRLEMDAWNIPTNLISEPIASFTAIRGTKAWLESLKIWQDLQFGAAPNQVYSWGLTSIPLQTFAAAPLPDASNWVYQFSQQLLQKGNVWMASNAIGNFQRSTNINSVAWVGVPFMAPYLQSPGDFLYGGCFAPPPTNVPPPPELFNEVRNRANLVYYDWEVSGARIQSLLDIGQLTRIGLKKPQLPVESISILFLKAIESKLGNTVTVITQESPRWAMTRKSSMGLTAFELHLLADWLESPQFPRGLNTTVGRPSKRAVAPKASPAPR